MTKQYRWFTEILKSIEKAGGEILEERSKKTYLAKIKIRSYVFNWAVAKTPSAKTAYINAINQLKRELEKAGLSDQEIPKFAIKLVSPSDMKNFDLVSCLIDIRKIQRSIEEDE